MEFDEGETLSMNACMVTDTLVVDVVLTRRMLKAVASPGTPAPPKLFGTITKSVEVTDVSVIAAPVADE
jgi:hypothetical protein